MSVREKLRERLNDEFGSLGYVFNNSNLERLYHGHHQRSCGAWSWMVRPDSNIASVGSQFSMVECLRAKYWHISNRYGDICIYPTNEKLSDEYDIRTGGRQ